MGLATGGLMHAIATVLDVSTVFSYSPALHTVVKIIGPAYLM
jgi:threonine/homoserine/homoserine lactone efflux protein